MLRFRDCVVRGAKTCDAGFSQTRCKRDIEAGRCRPRSLHRIFGGNGFIRVQGGRVYMAGVSGRVCRRGPCLNALWNVCTDSVAVFRREFPYVCANRRTFGMVAEQTSGPRSPPPETATLFPRDALCRLLVGRKRQRVHRELSPVCQSASRESDVETCAYACRKRYALEMSLATVTWIFDLIRSKKKKKKKKKKNDICLLKR